MEFKEQNRYNDRRQRITLPERGDTPRTNHRPVTPAHPPQPAPNSVHININFGALSKLSLPSVAAILALARRRHHFSKRALVITGLLILVAAGCVVAGISHHTQTQARKTAAATATNTQTKIVENLEYQTVLPEGKSIDTLGGWQRVSPPKSDPVYAYLDKIGTVPINVSQQPLPKSLASNDDQVAELAKKFNATTKIDAGDTKLYLGTSSKGPQSAIMTKNGLLILIKSQTKIDNAAWAKYAKSLN